MSIEIAIGCDNMDFLSLLKSADVYTYTEAGTRLTNKEQLTQNKQKYILTAYPLD